MTPRPDAETRSFRHRANIEPSALNFSDPTLLVLAKGGKITYIEFATCRGRSDLREAGIGSANGPATQAGRPNISESILWIRGSSECCNGQDKLAISSLTLCGL